MRAFHASLLLGSLSFATGSALLLDRLLDNRAPASCPTAAPSPFVSRVQWAATVRAFSSQYSAGQWSARQVLGPPNAYVGGDNPNAWASLAPDAGPESIEVGFAEPERLEGLQIFETFNPGAVRLVELIGASGRRIPLPIQGPVHELHFTCTDEPIVAARITLATEEVGGWNEIDAIGAVGCASM